MRHPINIVFYPDSNFRASIDCVSFMMILIVSLYIPVVFSFSIDTSTSNLKYLENIIDVFFLLEIMLNFNTGIIIKG